MPLGKKTKIRSYSLVLYKANSRGKLKILKYTCLLFSLAAYSLCL